jgi:hypothetical protein
VVVDLTGVGDAVLRVLLDGLMNQVVSTITPVTITAGLGVRLAEGGGLLVAKKELVGALQVLLQGRRLRVAPTLPEAPLLAQELGNFRAKVTAARAEDVLDWRERPHDDLVLAVALAAWLGEFGLPPLLDPPAEPAYTVLRVW